MRSGATLQNPSTPAENKNINNQRCSRCSPGRSRSPAAIGLPSSELRPGSPRRPRGGRSAGALPPPPGPDPLPVPGLHASLLPVRMMLSRGVKG